MAWRLAQAVAVSREAAVAAVGNGFARSLRGAKRHQPDDGSFRPLLLSAVYRSAMDDARAHAGAGPSGPVAPSQATRGSKGARGKANRDDAVLTEAAFRSLPERWRAALWLSEVEALETDRVAPILGVSAAVATQLVTRGTRGLAGRFAQARRPVPEHLGAALRPIGLAMPSNLGEVVAVRLKAVASDPGLPFAPISAWLSERAARPLQVAVGGLLGMGLIGIGLVGQGSSVRPGNVAIPGSPTGSKIQVTQPASFFPAGSPSGNQSAAGALNTSFTAAASGATTTAATTGSTGAAPSGGTHSTPSTTRTTPSGGGTKPPAGGTTTPGGTTTTPGGGTTTPPGGTTAPKTIVSLGPVASVTQSGSSITANVLPSTSGTAPAPVSVTLGCSTGLGLTVGTISVGCAAPSSSTTSTTTPTTTTPTTPTTLPIVGGLLGGVSSTLGGL
jgi:DNA-directed RNA polymerase specialized sigma24 family protein